MPARPPEDKLSEKHYISVTLRLLLDRRGRLLQGEIVDLGGKAQGRFNGWRGLVRVLRSRLASQPQRRPSTTDENGTHQPK